MLWAPPPRVQEFACGDIAISNLAHPQYTQVTISADLFSPGARVRSQRVAVRMVQLSLLCCAVLCCGWRMRSRQVSGQATERKEEC